MSLSTAISFFGASLLLAVAPGPDIIFVLSQSLSFGKKAGAWVAAGNVAGLIVPTLAAAFGLGALISASPMAYDIIKYIGAGYLIYLAIKAFRKNEGPELAGHGDPEISGGNLFLRGAIVSITNPHVTVLFVAFLPQFVQAERGNVPLQIICLGLIFMVAAFLIFMAVALASGMVRERISKSPSTLTVIDRTTGLVFIALALKLAIW